MDTHIRMSAQKQYEETRHMPVCGRRAPALTKVIWFMRLNDYSYIPFTNKQITTRLELAKILHKKLTDAESSLTYTYGFTQCHMIGVTVHVHVFTIIMYSAAQF